MRHSGLAWAICLFGCGADHAPPPRLEPPEAGATEQDTAATPQAPTCEALGAAASASSGLFNVAADFFETCGDPTPRPDRAFTWTAPATGLYTFQLQVQGTGADHLELRRGDCVLTMAEGAASAPAVEPICARRHADEGGTNPAQETLPVEAGETITIVVEGDDHYDNHDSQERLPQSYLVEVKATGCPATERVQDSGTWDPISDLPSALPLDATLVSRVQDDELRPLSCSTARRTRQSAVAWTAPSSGHYRFEVEWVSRAASLNSVALGVIARDCLGEELACIQHGSLGSLAIDLGAQDRVILLIELGDALQEDELVQLRIRAE